MMARRNNIKSLPDVPKQWDPSQVGPEPGKLEYNKNSKFHLKSRIGERSGGGYPPTPTRYSKNKEVVLNIQSFEAKEVKAINFC